MAIHALVGADVARLWSASSASAPLPPPVWSAFFGHPRLFERRVLGLVAAFARCAIVLLASLPVGRSACACMYVQAASYVPPGSGDAI